MYKLKIPKINFKKLIKSPIFWARFLGYAIPLAFLLYVLYINYLPFGYHKTFTINVGSENDTKVSEFYLEPSKDLSERKNNPDGTTYRELNGMAAAVFKPNVVLNNAEITVEAEGDGISIIPPYIDFDPNSVQWDYSWDFTKGIPSDLTNINNKAFYFDGATYFDGTARLELASSSDMFEDGPFTVYAEWMPIDDTGDEQQIIGHFNWELWQNKDSVSFQVGRMNDENGRFYLAKYKILDPKQFFNKKHTALIIYNTTENGYIDFFMDGDLAERLYFESDKIWKDYGNKNLSIGWTLHNYGNNPYFKGTLYKINFIFKNVLLNTSKINFTIKNKDNINFSIISNASSTLNKIKINAIKK